MVSSMQTIESPVIVELINNSSILFEVNVQDRIAQLILECI